MKTKMLILSLIFLASLAMSQAPQFLINSKTLGATATYNLSYITSNNLNSATTFTVNFNQSYIKIPNGTNNCQIKVNNTIVVSPTCSCSNLICTFKPNYSSAPSVVLIIIGNITNPYFMYNQQINVSIYFSPTINYNYPVVITSTNYQPMAMIVNNVSQTDYGVGYTPATYQLNISLNYISANMQMQVILPPQITYSNIITSLTFYNNIQNILPTQATSMLIFNLQVPANPNPNGYFILRLAGMGNPTFLGNSSSFKITFIQTTAITNNNCANCKIAQLLTGIVIQSTIPGDIQAMSITSTNNYITMQSMLAINLQLYAGIPQGGKVSIFLPPQIIPVLPIQCVNSFGFYLTDNNLPTCTYNSTANRIDTINFATPTFYSTGNGIVSIKIINPPDSRQVNLYFQTYDSSGRQIGVSRTNSTYSAIPMPLNATVSKSSQQVSTLYNLTCSIILGQILNNNTTNNNSIQIILPAANYNISNIICIQGGINLNCSKSIDSVNQLHIVFVPPCSPCATNTNLTFAVTNLMNPAYINNVNQQIVINTRSNFGIIQSLQPTILLTPSTLTITNYSKPTNQIVGTQYNLTLTVNIPQYVKSNGGQIILQFMPQAVYTDGIINSNGIYNSDTYQLQIYSNTSTTILDNSVQYYPNYSPSSINKIIFTICDGIISICSSSILSYTFIINKLKLPYIPSLSSTDTIIVTTLIGQVISQKSIDTSLYAPTMPNNPLSLNISNSITNSYSSYIINFISRQIVIDKQIIFTLPNSLSIYSNCILNTNISNIIISYTCTVISNNSINISMDIDQNIMIAQTIMYTIILNNVSTYTSMAPLQYSLYTTYNGTVNQKFNTVNSLQSALPISVIYSKTNYTINQVFRLSLTMAPILTNYDSWQVILPKNMVYIQQSSNINFTIATNSTHYLLNQTGVMTNNYTQITGKNSLITYIQPSYTLNIYQNGYLAQQATINIANNTPVVLGCTITMSNRTVSMYSNMSIICDRNSNSSSWELGEQLLVVYLPSNAYSYANAYDSNNNPINTTNPIILLPITASSPRIITTTVTNLINLNYIPNLSNSSNNNNDNIGNIAINTVSSLTNLQYIVGSTSITPLSYIVNDAYDIYNLSATRNNTLSGGYTNITINYYTQLGNTNNIMQISLPYGQNTFINTISNCFILTNSQQQLCHILSFNSSDIIISYIPNTTVLLTNLLNSYPNSNLLRVRILTSVSQLIEQGNIKILPAISLWKINITGSITSNKVGDISYLALQLVPTQLRIDSNNIIRIDLPTKLYTRVLNKDDCVIKPYNTNSYIGCTYGYDSDGWLSNVTLGSFGSYGIDINTMLSVNISVTNSWAPYLFNSNIITATVSMDAVTSVSQGTVNVVDLYQGLPTFTLLTINTTATNILQSQLQAATNNNITINLTVNGNVGGASKINLQLPKDSFIYNNNNNNNSTNNNNNNNNITLVSQDQYYYYLLIPTLCPITSCINFSQILYISVTNNYYIKKQINNIIIFIQYDNIAISQSYISTPLSHTALNIPNINLNRNNSIGGMGVNITINYSMMYNNNNINVDSLYGSVQVCISNNISYSKYNNIQYSYTQTHTNNNTTQYTHINSVSFINNPTNSSISVFVPSLYSNSTQTNIINIISKNILQVSNNNNNNNNNQNYWIVIQNSTHILYATYNLIFNSKLIPLNTGLILSRNNGSVGVSTQVSLQGALSNDYNINMGNYVLVINSISYGTLQSLNTTISNNNIFNNNTNNNNNIIASSYININQSLFPYTNPLSTSSQPTYILSLCTPSLYTCIYNQSNSPILPPLSPIQLSPNDISIRLPTFMNISSNYTMIVNFTNSVVNKNYIKIISDSQLYDSILACTGYYYDSINKKSIKISTLSCTSLTSTITTTTTTTTNKIIDTLTITDSSSSKLSLTSLQIIYQTSQYQTILPNTQLTLIYQLPTTSYSQKYNIVIAGINITASLAYTSLAANVIANYSVTVVPIVRNGIVTIQLPAYISDIYNGNDNVNISDDIILSNIALTVNNNNVPLTSINAQTISTMPNLYLLAYNTTTLTYSINILATTSSPSFPRTLTLQLNNILNPSDNRILQFKIYQHQYQLLPLQIYGYRQFDIVVSGLPIIKVHSGIRNATKIAAPISLQLDIQIPTNNNNKNKVTIIKLSSTQVIVNNNNNTCILCIDNNNCSSGITVSTISQTNILILSNNIEGRHNYTFKGCLTNSLYSQQPGPQDYIYVGIDMPYQIAQTTPQSTTFITPLLTAGQIQISNITYTSNNRVDYNNIVMNISPQNWQSCQALLFIFNPLSYIVHNNINVYINNKSVPIQAVNTSTLFVQVANNKNTTMQVKINNIINYIKPDTFTLVSMKKILTTTTTSTILLADGYNNVRLTASNNLYDSNSYGFTDIQLVSALSLSFNAYAAATRIIFPNNYVQSAVKTIMAVNDYNIPAQIPTSTLLYNFNSPQASCSPSSLSYNKTIQTNCQISSSGNTTFSIQLIDTKLSSSPLTSYSQQIYIYPQSEDHCNNVMCDVCSKGPNNNQYCFVCREGLYASNGICVNSCPYKQFPYKNQVCIQCSPDCQTCYDLYDNSCLSCTDTKLVLDSGVCRQQCSDGYSYQSKYCVNNNQCTIANGCRLCSPTGFCYQCLPDFIGQPKCRYNQVLPKTFFIFWLIPFILLLPIVSIVTCCKVGTVTLSHNIIYILSVIQLISWILIIPKLPQQALAMVMCAFLLLRIIISIVAYQTYYNKLITKNKQSKLLNNNQNDHQRQSEEKTDHLHNDERSKKSKQHVKNQQQLSDNNKISHKQRLVRFSAHFLACDAYELLMNKLGLPFMNIKHYLPYFILTIANRIIVLIFLFYVMSLSKTGDLLYMPIVSLIAGLGIILTRIFNSDKITNCVSKLRS